MIKYALELVFRQKLRTFLTSLGVTISVILLSFIIFGMQDVRTLFVNEFTSRFKANEVYVLKMEIGGMMMGAAPTQDESNESDKKEPVLLTDDVVKSVRANKYVSEVTELLMINGMQLRYSEEQTPFPSAFVFGWNVSGKDTYFLDFYGEKDTPGPGEALVAETVLTYFDLSKEDIIGKTIVLEPSATSFLATKTKNTLDKEYLFKIVGVIDTGRDRSDLIINLDEAVQIQTEIGGFTDSAEYLNNIGYDYLYVSAKDEKSLVPMKDFLVEELKLNVFTADDILSFLDIIINGLTLFLIVFGIISAIVASIGIINTMVMSIYEQTREIGINKAIGASNLQIMVIFLIQSAVIGLIGGIIGLVIVFISMKLADPYLVELLLDNGFTAEKFFHFDLFIALYITLASILVGVLAGLYPALKASRLDPVKALRYE